MRMGYTARSAWDLCFSYFSRRDYDGLEAFVAKLEAVRNGEL